MSQSERRDQYLQELRAQLGCFRRSRELVAEVEGHLDDSVRKLERDGMAAGPAMAEAISRLGQPRQIASTFATQGEPLAVPTRFTRAAGWVAVLALPFWIATVALVMGSEQAEKTRDWEGLPQTLWTLGVLAMLPAALGYLVIAFGLNRREGGLGTLGKVGIALLGFCVLTVTISWFAILWTSVCAVAFGVLAFQLRTRRSPFSPYAVVAVAGSVLAVTSGVVLVIADSYENYSLPFGLMLIPAVAVAALGLRLVREPEIEVPRVALA